MKFSLVLPLVAVALVTIGCGSKDASSAGDSSTAPKGGKFKVALITPGPVSDSGWNSMAYDGLKAIETELHAEVKNQEAQGAQINEAMRTYAQDGYNLIIGHGFEFNAPALEVAKDFPKVTFVTSSGAGTAVNVGAFRFYLEQGFYLAGMMAASMTKTGTIAMIGGDDVPAIRSTFKAFRAGAKAVKPNINVIETFTGDGKDVAAAKQAALSAIGRGADFLIHQANNGAQGVFNAAKEKGVYAFGANLDQNSNDSGVVLASAIIIARPAFVDLAKQVQAGTYKGDINLVGMQQGAIDFVVNPALSSKIPPDVMKAIDAAKADIKSGKLVIPKDEF
jgi:basic membrane protein A and related proteins